MSGRDDQGGLVILDCLQIIGGEHLVAFIGGDFQDRAELFQTGKAPLDIAMTQGVDGFPIRGVALAANLFYLHGLQSGVTFQQPERVAPFDGAMLRGVAGENDAAVLFLRQLRDLFELRRGQQPGLINQQNAVANFILHLAAVQQRGDRGCVLKTFRPEDAARGFRRRGEGKNLVPGSLDTGDRFLEHGGLACARAATDGDHAIRRPENVKHGIALLLGFRRPQLRILDLIRLGVERRAFALAVDRRNQSVVFPPPKSVLS